MAGFGSLPALPDLAFFGASLEVSVIVVATSLAPTSLLPDRSISLPLVLNSFQRNNRSLGAFRGRRGAHFTLSPISTGHDVSVTTPYGFRGRRLQRLASPPRQRH